MYKSHVLNMYESNRFRKLCSYCDGYILILPKFTMFQNQVYTLYRFIYYFYDIIPYAVMYL